MKASSLLMLITEVLFQRQPRLPNTSDLSGLKRLRDIRLLEDSPAEELSLLCMLALGVLVCPSQETGNTAKTQ